MRNSSNNNGVFAFTKEDYKLPIMTEITLQKSERSFWAHPIIITGLTIALSFADALVLYSVLDVAMLQSEYMGKIMAFTIALVLNFIPLLVAKFIHQAIYNIKRFALLWAVISIVAFLLLFSATVYLRFAYRDNYGSSSTTQLTNQIATSDESDTANESEDTEQKGLAVVILLCLEPLVTSIVNFGLAYLTDDELRERLNQLRIRRLELMEIESDLQAALANMDVDLQRLIDLDEERYKAAQDDVLARCEFLKALARHYLAEHLADPSSISKLSNDTLSEEVNVESVENGEPAEGNLIEYALRNN